MRRLITLSVIFTVLILVLLPSILLRAALFFTGGQTRFDSAHWLRLGLLEVRGIRYCDALQIDALTVQCSPKLFLGRIPEVRIYGAQGWLSRLATPSNGRTPGRFPIPLMIEKLFISSSILFVDNLGPGLPYAPLRLGDATPLLFTQINLGAHTPGEAVEEIQSATTEHLVFYSPYDPLAPVLSFDRIDIAFTWGDLTHNRFREVRITGPTIFLGDDLFAFVQKIKASENPPTTLPPPESTRIDQLFIENGRLVISLYGQPALHLPIHFAAHQKNLSFRDFSEIQLSTTFTIPPSDLEYPAQDISVHGLRGNLYFALGKDPDGTSADNIVPTVFADSISWKKLTAEKLSLSLTVNPQGLFGKVNAFLGGGSLDGGLDIYFKQSLPWLVWASVTDMDSSTVTKALTPDQVRLSSRVTAVTGFGGEGKTIRGGYGDLIFKNGGRLEIPSLAAFVDRIPQDWDWIKKGSAKAALSVLQDYSFEEGDIHLTYLPPCGRLRLNLRGPQGVRDVDISLR